MKQQPQHFYYPVANPAQQQPVQSMPAPQMARPEPRLVDIALAALLAAERRLAQQQAEVGAGANLDRVVAREYVPQPYNIVPQRVVRFDEREAIVRPVVRLHEPFPHPAHQPVESRLQLNPEPQQPLPPPYPARQPQAPAPVVNQRPAARAQQPAPQAPEAAQESVPQAPAQAPAAPILPVRHPAREPQSAPISAANIHLPPQQPRQRQDPRVPYVPKRQSLDDNCYICCDPFEDDEDVIWCQRQCGKNVHRACFAQWNAVKGNDRLECGCWYVLSFPPRSA